mgnify:CR=1 FL=1
MSKYDLLWLRLRGGGKVSVKLTFDEIENVAGVPIDHSFLKYKKELVSYGYEVEKISLKNKTVTFNKLK